MERKIRPFGLRDKFSYMMGDIGCNMVLSLANSYLLVFSTKVMGISAGIVGTLFMLARFVDAFTDVAVGRIVDTHVGKGGDRYRPWIAYGSVPLVVSSCLMYNYLLADADMMVKIVWLVVTYLLFGSVFYTAVNIPYGVMSAVISEEPAHRASLSTWRSLGSTIGGAALGIFIPLVIYTKDEAGNSVASGPRFFGTAVVMSVLALICLMICYFGSVERVHVQSKKAQNGSGNLQAILLCFKDRALLMNIGYVVFIYASTTVFSTFNQYLFLDYFGSTGMSGLASLVMMVGMLLAAPIASILAKRIGKKEMSLIGLAMSTVTYLVTFILRPTSVAVYFVAVLVAYTGIGMVTMVSYALMNDCIDNHYLNTGDNAGGTVYALNSFMRKLAGAICTGVGGWGLALIGYDELATVQTEAVRQSVFNLAIGIPMVCFVLALIFMALFPLNKKKVEEISRQMEQLRHNDTEEASRE